MTLSFPWWLWRSFSSCWQWFPWFWLRFQFSHFLRQTLLWTFCYRFPHLFSAIILLESSLARILSYFSHFSWDLLGVFILYVPGIGQKQHLDSVYSMLMEGLLQDGLLIQSQMGMMTQNPLILLSLASLGSSYHFPLELAPVQKVPWEQSRRQEDTHE